MTGHEKIWLGIGLAGQFFFTMRFIVQWLYSEYKKQSLIPLAFWIFSILGGLTLLAYALYRKDPVFILGQSFGCIVYFRNLVLIARQKKTPLHQPGN